MKQKVNTGEDIEILKTRTFYGREKENLVYPIVLANLVLQEIDEPHIWHGNTLTGLEVYGGLFSNAGAASKTNLLFFIKGEPTKKIWYYDLSDLNITKKQSLTLQHLEEFFKLLPKRGAGERSWLVPIEEIEAKNYDLKAVNPNRKDKEDKRTPEELISIIESQAAEIEKAVKLLKSKGI